MTDAPNPQGFTDRLEDICETRCAEVGDPACWRLPALVEPCEHISPCADCLADRVKELEARADLPAAVTVKPLTFSSEGFAHNGLGTMYRITFHNDATVGWILKRHEGSSETGLGYNEDRDELERLANADNKNRILSAINVTPAPVAGWRSVDSAQNALTFLGNLQGESGLSAKDVDRLCGILSGRTDIELRPLTGYDPEHDHPEQPDAVQEAINQIKPDAVHALASYQQADQEGIMVLVSRQAIEECLPALRALEGDE
jgi:hypothetical protein